MDQLIEPVDRHTVRGDPQAVVALDDAGQKSVFEHTHCRLIFSQLAVAIRSVRPEAHPLDLGKPHEICGAIEVGSEVELFGCISVEIGDTPKLVTHNCPAGAHELVGDRLIDGLWRHPVGS